MNDAPDECIHGLGPVSACTICNGRDGREAAAWAATPRTFPASHDGQCPGCNLPIFVGQTIAWLPDRRATHARCWS